MKPRAVTVGAVLLFHVATDPDWAAAVATGRYERSTYGLSLADVGFVHACASRDQLDTVLRSFYADVHEPLRLLVIDSERLRSPWQLDDVPGAPDPYPHVYGPVDVDAVIEAFVMTRTAEGWSYPWPPTAMREADA